MDSLNIIWRTTKEFMEDKNSYPHKEKLIQNMKSVRYCKLELYKNNIQGIIRIPHKRKEETNWRKYGFYLTDNRIVLIDDTGDLRNIVKAIEEKSGDDISGLKFLQMIFDEFINDDILNLQNYEEEMSRMEENIIKGRDSQFYEKFLGYRKRLSELHFYYEQMVSIGETMQSSLLIKDKSEEKNGWQRYTSRVERLHNYVAFLQEYAIHLRELYQSQVEAERNKIVNLLTVVTAIFLPLTLITGWYGMNFKYMPELEKSYSYPVVVFIAAVIVICEIIYFKRKKVL